MNNSDPMNLSALRSSKYNISKKKLNKSTAIF